MTETTDPAPGDRARADYPALFERWVNDKLSFRQLATLPEAAGVTRQAIQQEFRKIEWRVEKDRREQMVRLGGDAGAMDAALGQQPVGLDFAAPGPLPTSRVGGNPQDDEARRVLEGQRREIAAERERLTQERMLLDRVANGTATLKERELVLGINKGTLLDARRKHFDRERQVQAAERRVFSLDSQMREVRQFLPVVERRAVPTMPDAKVA